MQVNFHTPNVDEEDAVAGTYYVLVRNGLTFETQLRACLDAWAKREVELVRAEVGAAPDEEVIAFDHGQNWGDVFDKCPAELLLEHGLYLVPVHADLYATVDHDETLVGHDGTVRYQPATE
jgi:hypothetical protein